MPPLLMKAFASWLAVAGLAFTGPAQASQTYPEALQERAALACVPQCTLCHSTNTGGPGMVTQPFGVSMVAAGLTGGGLATNLDAPLAQLSTEAKDSDMDGKPDSAELAAGDDPNDSLGGALCGDFPTYGCGARIAPRPRNSEQTPAIAAVLTALACLIALARRRRS
jgi:hypothetical protein